MKKLALLSTLGLALVATLLVATPAAAQDLSPGFYAGAGYTHYDLEGASVGGVTGRVGYRFHPNFAVEGEATFGVRDDDNAELDNAYGVYAVGVLPVTSNLDLFARAGYQQLSVNGTGPALDIDDGGAGYGAGAHLRLTDRFGVRGEYTRLDTDGGESDAISLSGVVNF
jgi:outer membrane immunogenic protein